MPKPDLANLKSIIYATIYHGALHAAEKDARRRKIQSDEGRRLAQKITETCTDNMLSCLPLVLNQIGYSVIRPDESGKIREWFESSIYAASSAVISKELKNNNYGGNPKLLVNEIAKTCARNLNESIFLILEEIGKLVSGS